MKQLITDRPVKLSIRIAGHRACKQGIRWESKTLDTP